MKEPNFDFTQHIVSLNHLDRVGFHQWAMYPGMCFQSSDKWWGDWGKRQTIHEGVDLGMFLDDQGHIHRLPETTRIPAIHDGIVAGMISDFLGQSIIVIPEPDSKDCTIYAHVTPLAHVRPDMRIQQGEPIAAIAASSKTHLGLWSHLHVSMGHLRPGSYPNQLDWKTIHQHFRFVDPLPVLEFPVKILPGSDRGLCFAN